jgi:protein TonB
MGHVTFDSTTSSVRGPRRQWYTVPLSMLVHTVVLGALVVVPLVATGALPTPQSFIAIINLVPPPPAPPPPRSEAPPAVVDQSVSLDKAPLYAADKLSPEPMRGVVNFGSASPFTSAVEMAPIPVFPPVIPSPSVPDAPRRVGGDIREPRKIHDVRPLYPALARAARAQGLVIIEATIGKDGSVRDARVLRSQPLLDEAALAAVREWRYSPPLLNGVPVEVLMTVTVNFQLQ